jgi:hypothetical protein
MPNAKENVAAKDVRQLWKEYFPELPPEELRVGWFTKYRYSQVVVGFKIVREEYINGRFEHLHAGTTTNDVARYASATLRNLYPSPRITLSITVEVAYELMPEAKERFQSKLKPLADGCVVFDPYQKGPYRRFWDGHESIGAHVFAYYAHNFGCMPKFSQVGAEICHTCRNPRCCNPQHLYLGSKAVNLGERCYGRLGPSTPAVYVPSKAEIIQEILHTPTNTVPDDQPNDDLPLTTSVVNELTDPPDGNQNTFQPYFFPAFSSDS